MANYLEIENLSCGYRDGFRLETLSLSLSKGAFAGVIGCNGSGKSTFFKGLTGDLPLLSGKVMLNGINLLAQTLQKRARLVATVSQFTELSPMTVKEYVLMGRTPYRKPFQFSYTDEDMEMASRCIHLTGITHLEKKLITELSGGEQQMAAIACAIAQQPVLLLLDEPTSHLDITYQSKIMNLLQQLNEEEGLTIIMIVHDLNLASEYCNHLLLMKKGKALCQGKPEEVLTYQHIENAYNTVVVVENNPVSGKPVIFPVSERRLREFNRE